MAKPLIVTNGDEAVARLRAAEIEGDYIPWRDVLHEGPVPSGLMLEALSLVRAQFLSREYGRPLTDVGRQFTERNIAVRNHMQYQRVELWFEHDLYDQPQLIELLDFFASDDRLDGLWLVQASDHLVTLPAPALRVLAASAAPVTAEQVDAAKRAWAAFTAPTPERLATLAIADTPSLPFLGPALRRLLQELPLVTSGLGLTEERILAALAPGQRTVAEVFAATEAQEPARYLGDAAFFRRLDRLAFVPQPLISGLAFPSTRCAGGPDSADYRAYAAARVRLTETGRAAVLGRFDHAAENGIDRWFGGTQVTPKTMWRRDRDGRLALAPGTAPSA